MTSCDSAKPQARPTSPHLGIYRWNLGMVLSIAHRSTGVFLHVAILILMWLFSLNVFYPDKGSVIAVTNLLMGPLGRLFIMASAFSFFYHLFNGVRHLFWDCGIGFELKTARLSGLLALCFTVALTVLVGLMLFQF